MVHRLGEGHDYFGDHDILTDSGLELWGAPAMRSHPDNFFRTAWDTHFRNFEDFIPFMRQHNYQGVVLTSWSTSGVYSLIREPQTHVIDMIPSRRVYPMRGFDLLIDAYAKAIATDDFNPKRYVVDHAQSNYGLNQQDSDALWKHLTSSSDTPIGDASTKEGLLDARREAMAFGEYLSSVSPTALEDHFDHYRLMNDIRLFYLDLQLVRLESEYATNNSAETKRLKSNLKKLQRRCDEIDVRFAEMNRDNLYPVGIQEENRARAQELNALYDRIAKRR